MRKSRTHTSPAPTGRLTGLRPIAHDPDERQTREDRDYGQTIFTRRFTELPRFLTGRRG